MGIRWEVVDQLEVTAHSQPAAGGLCTATFEPVDALQVWRVERLVIYLSQPSGSSAFLYVDSPALANQRDGVTRGDFNVWEAAGTALLITALRSLCVQWTGAADGAVGVAIAQVRVEAQTIPDSLAHPLLG